MRENRQRYADFRWTCFFTYINFAIIIIIISVITVIVIRFSINLIDKAVFLLF